MKLKEKKLMEHISLSAVERLKDFVLLRLEDDPPLAVVIPALNFAAGILIDIIVPI